MANFTLGPTHTIANDIVTFANTGGTLADSGVQISSIASLPVTNAELATMAAFTIKGNATGLTAHPTDIGGLLGNAVLGDVSAALTCPTDAPQVRLNTNLTAPRIWTLPAAASCPDGAKISIIDDGGITTTNYLVVAAHSGDFLIGAGAQDTITGGDCNNTIPDPNCVYQLAWQFASVTLIGDGVSSWSVVGQDLPAPWIEPVPYPYNYNSVALSGAGLNAGRRVPFLNGNNVWSGTGVYPAIWNSTVPWTLGDYHNVIGAPSIGQTFALTFTSASLPGSPINTATITAVGGNTAADIAAALCNAVRANATLNTYVLCDQNVYAVPSNGTFNIAWNVNIGPMTVAQAAGTTGSISLCTLGAGTCSNKENIDAAVYQFNHNIPGYTLHAGDGPQCFQWFAQYSPLLQQCVQVISVSPIYSEISLVPMVADASVKSLGIGAGITAYDGAGASGGYYGLGSFSVPLADGSYHIGPNLIMSGNGGLFSFAAGTSSFRFLSTGGAGSLTQFGIGMAATGALDVLGSISALSAENPTTGAGVTLIGGGAGDAVVSFNWGTSTWQPLEIASTTLNLDPSQSATTGWQLAANVFKPRADNATTLGTSTLAPSIVYSHQLDLIGAGGNLLTMTAPATGTPAIAFGTASGTPAVTASGPLAINTGTGNITCTGCLSNTPAALTKTDDTNVTLTLGGTPSTALLQATSITVGWTGTLSGTRGGTGVNNGASTLTLGASLTTTGAGASTLALPATGRVFTFPNAAATLLSTAGATASANSGNPTPTASLTLKMMGLGSTCTITPLYSSRVTFIIQGQIYNTTNTDGTFGTLYYGTGAAPANAASTTGTPGNNFAMSASNGTLSPPFSVTSVITGLTPGTAYWFDSALEATTGGTAGIQNTSCAAFEM